MTNEILIPPDVCEDEVVLYLARRYKRTPIDIISSFLAQEGLSSPTPEDKKRHILLEDNEMAILRDMKIIPSET